MGSPGASVVKNPPANAGDTGLIPGLGRSPGEGNGNPLQDSCLGNPTDRVVCRACCKRVGHDLATKKSRKYKELLKISKEKCETSE